MRLLRAGKQPRNIVPATATIPPKTPSVVEISNDTTLQAGDSDVEERQKVDAGSDTEMMDESSPGGAKHDAGSAPITGTGPGSHASHTGHAGQTGQTSQQDSGSRGSQRGQEEEANTGNQPGRDRHTSQ